MSEHAEAILEWRSHGEELELKLRTRIYEIKDELNNLALMGAIPLWSSLIGRLDDLVEELFDDTSAPSISGSPAPSTEGLREARDAEMLTAAEIFAAFTSLIAKPSAEVRVTAPHAVECLFGASATKDIAAEISSLAARTALAGVTAPSEVDGK